MASALRLEEERFSHTAGARIEEKSRIIKTIKIMNNLSKEIWPHRPLRMARFNGYREDNLHVELINFAINASYVESVYRAHGLTVIVMKTGERYFAIHPMEKVLEVLSNVVMVNDMDVRRN